jgi:hypothetical protein
MEDTKTNTMELLEVREGTAPLYCKYDGQYQAQRAELTINFSNNTIGVDYDGNIGNSQSMDSWHGKEISFTIPNNLSSSQCEELLEIVKPLAEELMEEYTEEWNGSNWIGTIKSYSDCDPDETEIGTICRELVGNVYIYDTWHEAYEFSGVGQFLEDLEKSEDCGIEDWSEYSIVDETIEDALEYQMDSIVEHIQENEIKDFLWLKKRYPDIDIYFASIKDTDSFFGVGSSEEDAIDNAKDKYIDQDYGYIEKYPEEEDNIDDVEWNVI